MAHTNVIKNKPLGLFFTYLHHYCLHHVHFHDPLHIRHNLNNTHRILLHSSLTQLYYGILDIQFLYFLRYLYLLQIHYCNMDMKFQIHKVHHPHIYHFQFHQLLFYYFNSIFYYFLFFFNFFYSYIC